MRKTRIVSLLLALILAVSLCAPARAADLTEADDAIETADAADLEAAWGIHGLSARNALSSEDALDLDGEALLLYELTTGTMVYAKNIDEVREPASLTKLMTCLVAMEYGNLYDYITVTDSALYGLDPAGSSADLRAGETYTLEQLLYCLMVHSANDAASVIAEYISGSESEFVALMNEKAQALGCENTHFENPHGLHEEGHVSSARDMAKILSACLEYELFPYLYSTTSYTLPATESRDERTIRTTNYLISSYVTNEYLDWRVIGGKTGFTTPAGRCVACVADDTGGMRYLAVVMGAGGTDANGKTYYGSFRSASALFDFGFDQFTEQEALAAETPVEPFSVSCGDGPMEACTTEAVYSLLPWGFDPEDIRTEAIPAEALTAPITAGDIVGDVNVFYGDALLGQVPMAASMDVAYVEPRPPLPPAKDSCRGVTSPTCLPKLYRVAMAA